MLNIPLNDFWLPILGLIAIIIGISRLNRNDRKKPIAITELIVGGLVMLLSINNNFSQSKQTADTKDSLSVLHNRIVSLQEKINIGNDSLYKIGIEIDKKTGRLLIIDSQLLRQRITPTIVYNTYPSNPINIDKWFSDLSELNVYKRELAMDNILRNFPEKLSNEQLKQICKYLSRSNINPALNTLMSDQSPSNYLTSIMKDTILLKSPIEPNAWKYLIEKTNTNASFAEEKIGSVGGNWFSFEQLLVTALPINNSKFCFDLLNSPKIISLLLRSQKKDREEAMRCYDVIKRVINSNYRYKKYLKTSFFETMDNTFK